MRIFLDSKRVPSDIYRNGEWEHIKSLEEFKSNFLQLVGQGNSPTVISFDFDLVDKKDGKKALDYLVNISVKNRLKMPKVYLHCDDRAKAIEFENSLNLYTKKTGNSYLFEFVKRF